MITRPRPRGALHGRSRELEAIRIEERSPAHASASYEERAALQLRKWRLLHKYVRDHPFHVPESLPRSEQWARVLDHVKRALGEPEVDDWVIQQRDVADNLARGVHDLRPRKNGPCHALLLEFVRDRKRKALAVLRWCRGKGEPARPSFAGSKAHPPGGKA